MATLFFGKISSIDYKNGKADVTLTDKEDMVLTKIPFLAKDYDMPKIGDTVALMAEMESGRCDKAVILGPVWSAKNKPKESGKNIYYKEFPDGTSIKYNASNETMEIKAEKLLVNEVLYNKLTQR